MLGNPEAGSNVHLYRDSIADVQSQSFCKGGVGKPNWMQPPSLPPCRSQLTAHTCPRLLSTGRIGDKLGNTVYRHNIQQPQRTKSDLPQSWADWLTEVDCGKRLNSKTICIDQDQEWSAPTPRAQSTRSVTWYSCRACQVASVCTKTRTPFRGKPSVLASKCCPWNTTSKPCPIWPWPWTMLLYWASSSCHAQSHQWMPRRVEQLRLACWPNKPAWWFLWSLCHSSMPQKPKNSSTVWLLKNTWEPSAKTCFLAATYVPWSQHAAELGLLTSSSPRVPSVPLLSLDALARGNLKCVATNLAKHACLSTTSP